MGNGYVHDYPVRYEIDMYDTSSQRATLLAYKGRRIWSDESGLHIAVYVNARSHEEALQLARQARPGFEPFPNREPRLIYGGAEAVFEYEGKLHRW